jgi:hypothetical protein
MGLWPKDDKSNTSNFWSKLRVGIILCVILFVTNIPMIHAVIQVWGNMLLVVDNLRIALSFLTVLMKYVTMLRKQTGIPRII